MKWCALFGEPRQPALCIMSFSSRHEWSTSACRLERCHEYVLHAKVRRLCVMPLNGMKASAQVVRCSETSVSWPLPCQSTTQCKQRIRPQRLGAVVDIDLCRSVVDSLIGFGDRVRATTHFFRCHHHLLDILGSFRFP